MEDQMKEIDNKTKVWKTDVYKCERKVECNYELLSERIHETNEKIKEGKNNCKKIDCKVEDKISVIKEDLIKHKRDIEKL